MCLCFHAGRDIGKEMGTKKGTEYAMSAKMLQPLHSGIRGCMRLLVAPFTVTFGLGMVGKIPLKLMMSL
jgi:hypothetical protein